MDKIIIINLKERTDRLKSCLEALEEYGTPTDIIEVHHPIKVSDYKDQDAFLEEAGKIFPAFHKLKGLAPAKYLGANLAHLIALQKIESLKNDEVGLVLECLDGFAEDLWFTRMD